MITNVHFEVLEIVLGKYFVQIHCSVIMISQKTGNHVFYDKMKSCALILSAYLQFIYTLPTAEILSGKNVRAWVSMVSYLKK